MEPTRPSSVVRSSQQGALLEELDGRQHKRLALTVEQKLEVATAELDAARRETAQMHADAERAVMKLQVRV